ncbi:hypothetical protein [Ectobacillus ponti]|uniref:Uncharacterized protein n=1 Tax=Ectobacillus ponti TaxID=2961894 RepID=A0AA42BUS2_9BACI|nr:hypothetical protein [Ectobacillus ponti]MCP8970813.1 hypothetical protein [Ectobacillus ponti]
MYLIETIMIAMVCGLVPAVVGLLKEEFELGIYSFVLTLVSGIIFTYYATVPVAALCILFIYKRTYKKPVLAQVIPFTVADEESPRA